MTSQTIVSDVMKKLGHSMSWENIGQDTGKWPKIQNMGSPGKYGTISKPNP